MSLPVMILAAGRGTRMAPLTATRPKPLIEVAGRPLIDHALSLTEGFGPVAVNVHYRAAQLAAHLAGRGVAVLHEPELLDSGGGVRNALSVLGEGALATLNADAAWSGPNPLAHLARAFDPARMGGLLALVPRDRAIGRQGGGDFAMAPDGRLAPDPGGLVYTGAQILGPGVVGRWPPGVFSMWEIWRALMAEGQLFGRLWPGVWADVGHPGGIAQAEAMLWEAADVPAL